MAERDGAFDKERALADVVPSEADRFSGAESAVGEHGDECGVESAVGCEQVARIASIVLGGSGRTTRRSAVAGLADRSDGVGVEVAPFDGAFEDRLEDNENLADGGFPTPAAAISARMSLISSVVIA